MTSTRCVLQSGALIVMFAWVCGSAAASSAHKPSTPAATDPSKGNISSRPAISSSIADASAQLPSTKEFLRMADSSKNPPDASHPPQPSQDGSFSTWLPRIYDELSEFKNVAGIVVLLIAIYFFCFHLFIASNFLRRHVYPNYFGPFGYLRSLWEILWKLEKICFWRKDSPSAMNTARLRVEYELVGMMNEGEDPYKKLREILTLDRQHWLIKLPDCTQILKNSGTIADYLNALEPSDKSFLLGVRFEDGCLAPLFLIRGLLARYGEEWSDVIRRYRAELAGNSPNLPGGMSADLNEFQLFQLNCWLMWGPSIPICNCTEWKPTYAMQFGYGDENNSIPVFSKTGSFGKGENWVSTELLKQQDVPEGKARSVYAGKVAGIAGVIKLVPKQVDKRADPALCPAQESIAEQRLVVELNSSENIRPSAEAGREYYSAYVWIMFVICKKDGDPVFGTDDARKWRNLLPFFEHGNIADASTLSTLRDALVAKAAKLLTRIRDENKEVRLKYACAIDDSHCVKESIIASSRGEKSLRKLLEDRVKLEPTLSDRDRNDIISDLREDDTRYSSCHLPKIIDDYVNPPARG